MRSARWWWTRKPWAGTSPLSCSSATTTSTSTTIRSCRSLLISSSSERPLITPLNRIWSKTTISSRPSSCIPPFPSFSRSPLRAFNSSQQSPNRILPFARRFTSTFLLSLCGPATLLLLRKGIEDALDFLVSHPQHQLLLYQQHRFLCLLLCLLLLHHHQHQQHLLHLLLSPLPLFLLRKSR